jgi:transposase-like protein
MVLMPVLCPHCHSDYVIKGGKTKAGQQRFKCQNSLPDTFPALRHID